VTVFKVDAPRADVEQLFGRLELIAPALAVAGALIIVAGLLDKSRFMLKQAPLRLKEAVLIGAVQGLCLPFRVSHARVQRYQPACLRVFARLKPKSSALRWLLTDEKCRALALRVNRERRTVSQLVRLPLRDVLAAN